LTFWRLSSWYRDTIVGLVCLTLVLTPFFAMLPAAYADEVVDEANKGQDTGANLILNYQIPGINNGPAGTPLGPNEIGIQDIFPGFDPADPTQLDPFTGLLSDPTNLSTQGVAQQFSLQSGTGNEAEAYQSVTDGSNNPHNATIDLRNDNFLDRSREIIAGNDPILDEILTACAEDVTAGDPGTDTITRLEDVYTCSQLRTGLSGTCTVDRDFILLPVATQTILAVLAGGVCVGVTGNDLSDWNAIDPVIGPNNSTPAPHCQQVNGVPTMDWHIRNFNNGPPAINIFHFANFCGEFDTSIPTAQQCTESARMLEHSCRNADNAGNGWYLNSNVAPIGSCSSYSEGPPGVFNGTVAVDYTGCDADRINYCQSVARQFEGECGGSICQGATCGSGKDHSDWSVEWNATTYPLRQGPGGNVHWCRTQSSPPPGNMHFMRRGQLTPFTMDFQYLPYYCGEFDAGTPSASECRVGATMIEHACRNALNSTTSFDQYQIQPSSLVPGPVGSCATFNPQEPTLYDGTIPVDYTGCDADRQNYCEAIADFFATECAGDAACQNCTPGGEDLSDWQALYGASIQPESATHQACGNRAFNMSGALGNDWYMVYREPTLTSNHDFVYGRFCGEFDTAVPSAAECAATGNQLEWACATANMAGDGYYLNDAHPTAGPVGSCIIETWPGQYTIGNAPTTPVTWGSLSCNGGRQAYCQAFRAAYEAECNDRPACTGGCVSEDNIAIYNVASYYDNTGPVHACRTNRIVFNYSTPPGVSALGGAPKDFSFMIRQPIDPGDYDLQGWSTDACGNADGGDCVAQGQAFEDACNNVSSGWPVVDPSGNTPTPAYCAAERATFEANCATANQCFGPPGGALLNGTETLVSPGIGPGFLEILADQNVFGATVDFEETAFNPGDYGLAAGEYVISNHTIAGNGVMASTIDDHGSYGSNWDFTSTLTLSDSDGFTVDATLYEVVANGFIFTGCSQADVQNVESGVCTGSVTCTDYTPPCRIVDGVVLCEAVDPTDGITEVLTPWSDFTSAVPEMCWSADVDIVDCVGQTNCIGNPACVSDCGHLPPELQPACLADACWIDAQGALICLDDTSESWANNLGDPNFIDDCQDLINDPACTLMPDVACIEGMEDASDPTNVDLCRLRQRFFDCGQDVTVPGVPGADDVDITCGAQIRCLGDECGNTEAESNPDFVRAAVASTTLTESTKDMTCDIAGDPTSCKIFEGTDNRCKDPRGSYLGIIPDCCKQAREAAMAAGDFALYMQLATWSFRLARDPMVASWLAQSQVLPSALQNVVNTPGAIRKSVGRAITTGFNSALEWAGFNPITIATETPVAQGLVNTSVTGFGPLQQYIATGFYNFLTSIGAEQLAQSLFQTTIEGTVTDWAADGLGEMVGNVFGTIMFIYTVYSIVKILGNIIFACEEEELSFGIQLVNRACHHVGTYCSKKVRFLGLEKCVIETQTHCCFSSPFARIINEQLRAQGIGPDWGTATEPNCDGIQISELQNVDWDLVDLSEWEAILFEAGLVPNPNSPPLNFVPSDRLPGVAAGGSEGMTSTDIMSDTIDLIMPEFGEARFDLEGAPLNQPDPELMPWYDDGVP
jgi:hypothetical protein